MTHSTPETRRVLMCGGPANGCWRDVEPGEREIHVMEPQKIDFSDLRPEMPAPRRIRYRVMPMVILGHDLWVAVAVGEAYDDRAILRNILQRDVAQHLGVW